MSTVPSLSPPPAPAMELNMAPPLEKQFKKPPPMGNRRRPTKQHLQEKKGEEVTDLDGKTVCVYVCVCVCVCVFTVYCACVCVLLGIFVVVHCVGYIDTHTYSLVLVCTHLQMLFT